MKSMNVCAAAMLLLCLFTSCENRNQKSFAVNDITTVKQEDENKQEPSEAFIPPSPGNNEEDQQNANNSDTVFQKEKKQIPKTIPQARIDWDKKIIKTAALNAEVKDYNSYYSSLREKVRSIGGYVAQEEQSQSEYKIENSLTVKVPVDQFDEALSLLTSGTVVINERKITSNDVTTEIVDTRSRMEAKKQVRERYIDLLKQAKNMPEILSVQSEINGIQEEIESATGRISYLNHASVFSTINFTFYQVLDVAAKEKQEPSVLGKIGHSFKIGWVWAVDFIVTLIAVWPFLLFSWIAFLLIRKYKRLKPKAA